MKKYNLFVDDERTPTSDPRVVAMSNMYTTLNWVVARSYIEFKFIIETHGVPEIVSFDHDLGLNSENPEDEQSGKKCVEWLVEYCHEHKIAFPDYNVHSANTVGVENINSYIISAKRNLYI